MALDRKALRAWLARLREVLNREWDPIGVLPYDGGPEDEYDSYRDALASLIAKGASDHELAAFIEISETETMGLGSPRDVERWKERIQKVVTAMRALGPPPKSHEKA